MTNTISTTVTTGIVLDSGDYGSQLSITTSGDVAPTAYGTTGILALQASDSIDNAGTISGGAGGSDAQNPSVGGNGGTGVSLAAGTLVNKGTIDGGAGGAGILGGMGRAGGAGIFLNGGTVTNAGVIAGGAGGQSTGGNGVAGDAVQFGSVAGTLIINPGAVFIGNVVADASVADVLVLASAATTGTLSGLGSQFSEFSTLIEDAGASWIFTGSNTLAGTVLFAGGVVNEGTITGDGSLTVTGQLINVGTISLDSGLTLTGKLTNFGTIIGGTGNYGTDFGGNGMAAIYLKAGYLANSEIISGGHGGGGSTSTSIFSTGGDGGTGVDVTDGTLINVSTVNGGDGGNGALGGAGGAGAAISGGSLTNNLTICGGTGGASYDLDLPGGTGGAGVALIGGSLINDKTIAGGAGGTNTIGIGSDRTGGHGGAGIYLNGGTVKNAGIIVGGAGGIGAGSDGAAGDAVVFGTASGTLIVDPGAVFIGNVVADSSVADMLVLASTATTGTLSGLGSQFSGFSTLIEDAGANWIFTGSNTLAGTVLFAGDVANEGTMTGDGSLTVTGQLINDETISLDSGLTLTGMLSNRGAINGGNGSYGVYYGGAGRAAIYMNAGLLINGGTIGGGYGGGSGSFSRRSFPGRAGQGGAGLDLAGGTLTNQQTVDGGEGGAGYYGGTGGAGVAMSGGVLTNERTINGGSGGEGGHAGAGGAGIAISGGSLTNSGTINGGAGGLNAYVGFEVPAGAGGAGVLLTAGTVTNDMTINGGAGGGLGLNLVAGKGGAGVAMSGGALTNNKTIDGGAGGAAINSNGTAGAGGAGVYFNGGTLTNAGTIAGGAGGTGFYDGAAGDAVQFGAASGTLVINPSAVFIGNVVADASAEDVLVLASANAIGGTLSGLGSQFTGFSVLDFTPNVRWTVEGSAAAFASLQSINNFAHGDTIVLEGFADNPADTTYVSGVGLELTDTSGNQVTIDIVEPAGATTANFTVTDPQAETTITYTACFAAGTRILCADGQLTRVEDLAVGTALERFDGTAATIDWIGVRTLDLRLHPNAANVQPILITHGALGGGIPWRDLVVSPDHAMYLQGHLIPAKALLNGFTVRQLKRTHVTYYHVELPAHAVIFAEGAAAESYLESGNRGAFENGGGAVTLHPDFANPLRLAKSCAPFVEDGPVVEAVRVGMLQRAAIATTDDPALSIAYDNGAASINSRSAVPGEMFADPRDRRRLGVKVGRLTIGGTMVRLDHPELAQGWHGVEPDGRWTDGGALIPSSLIPPGSQIVIELAAAMHYPMSSQRAKLAKTAC